MAKEWTDDEVQEEIKKATRMVHEDRERITYLDLHKKYGGTPESTENDPKEPGNAPPPKEGEPPKEEVKKKKSLYWGESSED